MSPTHEPLAASSRVPRRQRPTARLAALLVALGVAAASACYEDPQAKMDQMQQMTDLADVVTELSMRTAELGFTVDSLRAIVQKQDSTIWRLANLAGVPYQR
jgi:hypothetical protein